RDETRPLRSSRTRAADDVPAGAARRAARGTARSAAAAVGRQRDVDEHAGAGARLPRDVGDAPLAFRDDGAEGRLILVVRPREHLAEAAAGVDPADLCDAGVVLTG